MPSCNTYHLTWVSLTLDVRYLFMAAPAKRREIEENNRMGKTRDLFKKIRDTKGIFHVKMGSIKDRNDMDLTEAEGRGGKNTQKNCTKKIFTTQIITMV